MDIKIKRALISVSDKNGVVDFARKLSEMGVEIISTGGTAKKLSEEGVEVISIDSVTGFPEMMNGRVKTLHPKIHGALLAVREDAGHAASMKEHNIIPIDLVCVNLYPFEKTVAKPDCTLAEAIENIDIGGPSMVRSASKNHKYVTIVTSPCQYDSVINEMENNNGAVNADLRLDLARVAFGLTASYDAAISKYLNKQAEVQFPERISLAFLKDTELRYGENPHQEGAFYKFAGSTEISVGSSKLLHGGAAISFNNSMDTIAALESHNGELSVKKVA